MISEEHPSLVQKSPWCTRSSRTSAPNRSGSGRTLLRGKRNGSDKRRRPRKPRALRPRLRARAWRPLPSALSLRARVDRAVQRASGAWRAS